MPKIEIESFFYDLIHCKDKVIHTFDDWDEKYGDDERGPLVAGMRECPDDVLINLLINIQKLASGYEQIQELIRASEEKVVEEHMNEEEEDDDDDDD
ncbi:MAG: hypothetical protein ACE5EK_04160 [Nitrospinales bacterium]